jgi:hypothetical protein
MERVVPNRHLHGAAAARGNKAKGLALATPANARAASVAPGARSKHRFWDPYRTCGAAGECRHQGNRSGYCCFYPAGVQFDPRASGESYLYPGSLRDPAMKR